MKTELISVHNLSGTELNLCVAMCENHNYDLSELPDYCGQWEVGGEIIEREKISVTNHYCRHGWRASKTNPDKPKRDGTLQWKHYYAYGDGPLISAMRCYVISKLGRNVNVPKNI